MKLGAPRQLALGLPNQAAFSASAELRRYLRESAIINRSWSKRGWMVKDRLSPIVHWLRTNGDVPDQHNQPWFKSYTEVWAKVSTAYSVGKQLTEGAYRNDPKKRRKLQERLSFEVTTALDAFDNFVEEFNNG